MSTSIQTNNDFLSKTSKPNPINNSKQNGLAIESADRKLSKVFLGSYNSSGPSNFYVADNGLNEDLKQLGKTYKFQVSVEPTSNPWLEDTYIIKADNTRVRTPEQVEGGNILTITNKQGKKLSLIGERELQKLGNGNTDKGLTEASKLLNIPKETLIMLPQPKGMYFHIDGLMTGLRNGVVGLNSPKLMLEALNAVDTAKLSKLEKLLLQSHIKTTTKEVTEHQSAYTTIEQTLKKHGFDVEPLPAYSEAGDWTEATEIIRNLTKSSDEQDFKEALKNPYVKTLIEEYGESKLDARTEKQYEDILEEDYKTSPISLKAERALYHINKNFNSRILFANGIGGVDDTKGGYFISNGDRTFPSLNKAFETSLLKNSQRHGIQNVELLKHQYPNSQGGIQCLTNEIGTPVK
jgi:virulence-associated protein VapD